MASGQPRSGNEVESLGGMERELRGLLRRVRRQSAADARAVHAELTPTAYAVLLAVLEHQPTRVAHIVEDLGIDKGAVSRQVAQLERLGLVARTTDPLDGRAQALVAPTGPPRSQASGSSTFTRSL